MTIKENLEKLHQEIPDPVNIVAVSKTMPVELILEAHQAGQRVFGENKALEMNSKHALLPADIHWHFIGHLQTNKVKYIAPFVEMIQSADSFKLLQEIDKQAVKHNRVIKCLLQFHIATEETKFGLDLPEAEALLCDKELKSLKNITINGVMGMASLSDDINLVRSEFHHLKEIFNYLKNQYFADDQEFKEISMGMTGDYNIAVEEGSTMVRVGYGIFGKLRS
jgi:PLP dependent protein